MADSGTTQTSRCSHGSREDHRVGAVESVRHVVHGRGLEVDELAARSLVTRARRG